VLAEAFGVVEGITVDTHVIRFVQRFDLSDHTDAVRIERDLMELLPRSEWRHFPHRVIHYGRYLASPPRENMTLPATRSSKSTLLPQNAFESSFAKSPLQSSFRFAGAVCYYFFMAYDFKPFEKRIKEIEERLKKELSAVRTGRASPSILDGVLVESFGSRMPINQLATISVEDARTLRVVPWDQSNAKEIEKAITVASLGLSVGADEKGVRVFFPELTAERRASLLKLAKEKVEEGRAALRIARDEVWSAIQKQEKEKKMSEDDKFRAKDEMQKKVDQANKSFDEHLARKEKEIAS
jgi:ribosome recycling factor